jgi:hypothetical protein
VLDQQSGDREADVPGEISHLDGSSDYLSCFVYDADSDSDLSAYGRGAPSWRGKASQDGKRIQRGRFGSDTSARNRNRRGEGGDGGAWNGRRSPKKQEKGGNTTGSKVTYMPSEESHGR